MDQEIATERHSILLPYRSRPRWLVCPHAYPQDIDEGEHHIPRAFEPSVVDSSETEHHQSIPQLFIVASRNSFTQPTRPSTSIVPRQIESHRLPDDSVSLREDSEELYTSEEDLEEFYGEGTRRLWGILEEVPGESELLVFVKVLAYYNSGAERARELVRYMEQTVCRSKGIITVIILSLLEDFYLRSGSPLFAQLRETYEKCVGFYSEAEDFEGLKEKVLLLSGYSTVELRVLRSREEYVNVYKEKLMELSRSTGGLTKGMFVL